MTRVYAPESGSVIDEPDGREESNAFVPHAEHPMAYSLPDGLWQEWIGLRYRGDIDEDLMLRKTCDELPGAYEEIKHLNSESNTEDLTICLENSRVNHPLSDLRCVSSWLIFISEVRPESLSYRCELTENLVIHTIIGAAEILINYEGDIGCYSITLLVNKQLFDSI